ncbi:MAG: hypothetical protein SFY96_08090 [Planctomycetota bacterium]|nr:hypothetical protein [Planctomycetota bacterium]
MSPARFSHCAGSLLTIMSGTTLAAPTQQSILESVANGDALPVHLAGHIYINLKTGERRATLFEGRSGVDFWNNDDGAVCGNFFYGVDRPTRPTTDPRPKFGGSVNCIGELPAPPERRYIDGLGFATASIGIKSTDTINHATPGFDMHLFFYDNDDASGTQPDTRAQFVRHIRIGDIPGEEGTRNAWTFSIDLAGGNEFTLGDQDLDGDGLKDFGWGYSVQQNQSLTNGINSAKGICGPFLVAPQGFVNELGVASTSTSTGVPNRIHWYSAQTFDASGNALDRSHQSFIGSYNFGTPTSTNPYASTYLVMAGPCWQCAFVDFNGDCFVDFTDFDDFVHAFETGDPSSDINADGFLDFTDFDAFVVAFELC